METWNDLILIRINLENQLQPENLAMPRYISNGSSKKGEETTVNHTIEMSRWLCSWPSNCRWNRMAWIRASQSAFVSLISGQNGRNGSV